MSVDWTVCHERRLVEATLHGDVRVEDLRAFFQQIWAGGLRAYAKLLDFRHAALDLRASDVRSLAEAHLADTEIAPTRGPTAIVVHSLSAQDIPMLYDKRSSGSPRALSVFDNRERAMEWLTATAASTASAALASDGLKPAS